VVVTVRHTDPLEMLDYSYVSELFDDVIAGERVPLQDQYVGPRIRPYQGRSDISTSFAYGLERLP
jgi:hypothetical protein